MKKQKETSHCHRCEDIFDVEKLYKFTWRYTDKTKKYSKSKRFIVHTGYSYLCKTCLLAIISM